MKFLRWVGRNLSNIFGLIGIFLTLYLGVFYVPSWLRDAQNEKSLDAQKNLQQSVKELIYSDSNCSYSEIANLIKAKELDLNQNYPYTPENFLIQVQESFMQDRFLPLEKRKELMYKLESLKKQIPKYTQQNEVKTESKIPTWSFLLEWLSIIGSILAVVGGIVSSYNNYNSEKEKDQEIENQIVETENLTLTSDLAYDFEKQITSAIASYPGVIIRPQENRDFGFDLEFEFNGNTYFVEAKYLTRSKVGLNSFQRFLAFQKGLEGRFWFIYNTDITAMVKNRAEEWNKISSPNREIKLIKAESGIDLKRQLDVLLSNR